MDINVTDKDNAFGIGEGVYSKKIGNELSGFVSSVLFADGKADLTIDVESQAEKMVLTSDKPIDKAGWTVRPLEEVTHNTINLATVTAGGAISLPAGSYYLHGVFNAYMGGKSQVVLLDKLGSEIVLEGEGESGNKWVDDYVELEGTFELEATGEIVIRQSVEEYVANTANDRLIEIVLVRLG